ncbi:SCP-like protein, partial [Oesophagostomum dentatum]
EAATTEATTVADTTAAQADTTAAAGTTEAPITEAPATQEVTTQAQTTIGPKEEMTQEMRDRVLLMHNYRRSQLAQGLVRNGVEGNPNCPQGMNIYRMKYDMDLENEALAYANTCPAGASDVSTRPNSGENTHIFSSATMSYYDALVYAVQQWWTQLFKAGINAQMKYNQNLETREYPVTGFTQVR